MVERLIGLDEFATVAETERLDRYSRADLGRFDYDPVRVRCALVTFGAPQNVAALLGERGEPVWSVVMAGNSRRWSELHAWGVMFFGDPPWRRSQVISVTGRLGCVEAAVRALAVPGPEFSFMFDPAEHERDGRSGLAPSGVKLPAGSLSPSSMEGGVSKRFQETLWRRASRLGAAEDERKARAPKRPRPVQGELF